MILQIIQPCCYLLPGGMIGFLAAEDLANKEDPFIPPSAEHYQGTAGDLPASSMAGAFQASLDIALKIEFQHHKEYYLPQGCCVQKKKWSFHYQSDCIKWEQQGTDAELCMIFLGNFHKKPCHWHLSSQSSSTYLVIPLLGLLEGSKVCFQKVYIRAN